MRHLAIMLVRLICALHRHTSLLQIDGFYGFFPLIKKETAVKLTALIIDYARNRVKKAPFNFPPKIVDSLDNV